MDRQGNAVVGCSSMVAGFTILLAAGKVLGIIPLPWWMILAPAVGYILASLIIGLSIILVMLGLIISTTISHVLKRGWWQ